MGSATSILSWKSVEALPQSPLMENSHVFIDGFHWFTPTHYELIYTLFDLAKEAKLLLSTCQWRQRLYMLHVEGNISLAVL